MHRVLVLAIVAGLAVPLFACSEEDGGDAISQKDLLQAIQNRRPPMILDLRTRDEYDAGHIPGALSVPFNEVGNWTRDINARSKAIVVYCESSNCAGTAQQVLINDGFQSVSHLEGGMNAWREQGLPCDGCEEPAAK